MGGAGSGLLGRTEEQRAIEAVLDAARHGSSGVLVLEGEAGMGKTALLDWALASAADMSVARIAGVQSEGAFGFGALHRLLVPFMDRMAGLPERQRDAIGTAFGVRNGPPPDRFIVGLAALTVLADAAVDRPLLCVIDDAQWLDGESFDALALIGRRLFAEGIAMLFGLRAAPGAPVLEGIPVLSVAGLPDDAALELLESVVTGPMAPSVAQRIIADTGGCPLALREVAVVLRPEQLTGDDALPEPLPIGGQLERHFLLQVRTLPPKTQTALLVAAAEPAGDRSVVWRASKLLGIEPTALQPAQSAGLIDTSRELAFRHPLIRSAVYSGATADERRAAHRALAEATDPESGADARAWHLAEAATGPNAATAAVLVSRAVQAHERGRYAAEATFWSRAADLTPDARQAAERLLAAAQARLIGGSANLSRDLLARARPHLATPRLLAQAHRLEAALNSFTVPSEIARVLLEAARQLEDLDPRLARDIYADALAACAVSAQLTTGTTPRAVALAALRAPAGPDRDPTIADALLDAFATRYAIGYAEAAPAYRRSVAMLCASDAEPGISRWSVLGSKAAEELWDERGYVTMLRQMERTERERGALDSLRITLNRLADYEMWTGRFVRAHECHTEAAEISAARAEDATRWNLLKAELFAWQGREPEARTAAAGLMADWDDTKPAGVAVNSALLALAVLDIANGRYDDALASARQIFDNDSLTHGNHCLRELVEAGVRSGNLGVAATALARLEERAQASGTPWALGLLARARALMTDGADAEQLYSSSLGQLATTRVKTDLARTHLLYGEWLRRRGRRTDARAQLRHAHGMFVAMGAEGFAERAARELAATGERARRRRAEVSHELTPQEARIARLAGTGATSKEIAAELFLSPRTVDAHLRSIFPKLGITSRRQLRDMRLP